MNEGQRMCAGVVDGKKVVPVSESHTNEYFLE